MRCATTGANINLQTIGLGTIDGVQLVAGDRVLVKDQTDQTTNGIYNASSGVWAASSDFQNNTQLAQGTEIFVTSGTSNGGVLFWLTTANPITLGSSLITFGVLQVARGLTNVRLAKTANYTVGNADKGSTIALGGNAFFTLTVNAASGYDGNFSALIFNEDSGRGKTISINGITSFILWPLQACLLFNDNGTWQIWPRTQRWQANGAITFNVDPVAGNDSNDGLATGSGAFLTLQGALVVALFQVDYRSFTGTVLLANGTYSGSAAVLSAFGQVVGNATVSIKGNAGQGANVLWQVPTGQVGMFIKDFCAFDLDNITFSGGTGAICLSVGQFGIVDIGAGVTFGNCPGGIHIEVTDNGSCNAVGGYGISGTAYGSHMLIESGGQFNYGGQAINVSGAATFTNFVEAFYGGTLNAGGATFTGAGAGDPTPPASAICSRMARSFRRTVSVRTRSFRAMWRAPRRSALPTAQIPASSAARLRRRRRPMALAMPPAPAAPLSSRAASRRLSSSTRLAARSP